MMVTANRGTSAVTPIRVPVFGSTTRRGADDPAAAERDLPPEERDRVYGLRVPGSGRQTFEIAVKGFPADASKVRCPMLVVGAGKDTIMPSPQVTRKVAEKYGADLRAYEGVAHVLLLEPGWGRVTTDVADWLAVALRS